MRYGPTKMTNFRWACQDVCSDATITIFGGDNFRGTSHCIDSLHDAMSHFYVAGLLLGRNESVFYDLYALKLLSTGDLKETEPDWS